MIARGTIRLLKAAEMGRARRELVARRVRRILLVETTRFGDLMAVFAVLPRFRATFPDASITLLIHPDHASVLPAFGITSEVITFPWPSDRIGCIGTLLALQERRYDLACSMSPAAKNALLTLAARADVRTGYLAGNSPLTSFRDELLVESTGLATAALSVARGTNLYDRAGKVADHLGCVTVSAVSVKLPASIDAGWPALARTIGIDITRPYLVMHPFAAWRFREWPMNCMQVFISALKDAYRDAQVVLIGTDRDILRASAGPVPLPSGIAVLATRDWTRTALLVSHARAFVGTDSGPLHLASAMGGHVVGLFGPASPKFTAPPYPGRRYLFTEMRCSPCDQLRCVLPEESCMSRISGRQVFEAVTPFFVRTDALVANA